MSWRAGFASNFPSEPKRTVRAHSRNLRAVEAESGSSGLGTCRTIGAAEHGYKRESGDSHGFGHAREYKQ